MEPVEAGRPLFRKMLETLFGLADGCGEFTCTSCIGEVLAAT